MMRCAHGETVSFLRALKRTNCCTAEFIFIVRVDSNCIHFNEHAYFSKAPKNGTCFAVTRFAGLDTSSARMKSLASSDTSSHLFLWNSYDPLTIMRSAEMSLD